MAFSGRGTYTHLLAVAKKKPALQAILDDLENLSEKDIKALTGQPGWVKKILTKQAKEKALRPEGALSPEEIAEKMNQASNAETIASKLTNMN